MHYTRNIFPQWLRWTPATTTCASDATCFIDIVRVTTQLLTSTSLCSRKNLFQKPKIGRCVDDDLYSRNKQYKNTLKCIRAFRPPDRSTDTDRRKTARGRERWMSADTREVGRLYRNPNTYTWRLRHSLSSAHLFKYSSHAYRMQTDSRHTHTHTHDQENLLSMYLTSGQRYDARAMKSLWSTEVT